MIINGIHAVKYLCLLDDVTYVFPASIDCFFIIQFSYSCIVFHCIPFMYLPAPFEKCVRMDSFAYNVVVQFKILSFPSLLPIYLSLYHVTVFQIPHKKISRFSRVLIPYNKFYRFTGEK